jgi:hypothetical protein
MVWLIEVGSPPLYVCEWLNPPENGRNTLSADPHKAAKYRTYERAVEVAEASFRDWRSTCRIEEHIFGCGSSDVVTTGRGSPR